MSARVAIVARLEVLRNMESPGFLYSLAGYPAAAVGLIAWMGRKHESRPPKGAAPVR